jgi:hypothetical protein
MVDSLGVLDRNDDRRRPGIETELQRRRTRVREQTLLELRIDPGARDKARTVGRRTGHKPIDPPAHVLATDHTLLDEQLLERPNPGGGRRLLAVRNRLVRMIMVALAHPSSSSQCSKTST